MTDDEVETFLIDSWVSVRVQMDAIVQRYAPTLTTGERMALVSELLDVEPF